MSVSWEHITPKQAGWELGALGQLDDYLESHFPRMTSFLVASGDQLIIERYRGGADLNTRHDLRSATKSFLATLIGLAIGDGVIRDVRLTLRETWPDQIERMGKRKGETTVHDLLTMTSGMHWMTGNRLGEKWIRRLHESKDWLRFILRLPIQEEWIGRFLYRSTDSHLLSCLLTRWVGMKAKDYAEQRLFKPLGIREYVWDEDPQGHTYGHIGLRLRSRDMAALGLLYLKHGVWQGERLLSEEWIDACLHRHTEGMPRFGAYGYQWWSDRWSGMDVHMALGHGGQLIMVIPQAELVAVTTGEPRVSRWKHPRVLMERFIFPASGVGQV